MDADLIILKRFIENHPQQAAQLAEKLQDEEVAELLMALPADLATSMITSMSSYKSAHSLRLMDHTRVASILEILDPATVTSILRNTDEQRRGQWLSALSPELSSDITQKLQYSQQTVGAVMYPLSIVLREDMTLGEARGIMQNNQDKLSPLIYIVDEAYQLVGGVYSHNLLLSDEHTRIREIMITELPRFFDNMTVESIRNDPAWSEYRSVPVVDRVERLVGVLRFEHVLKSTIIPEDDASKHVMETGNALGELYRIGVTGFLQSLGASSKPQS